MAFELLDHPADIGFRTRAATLAQLFANCGEALVAIILDPAGIQETQNVPISATGSDLESLLVNWLNEVLYYVDGRRLAFSRFDVSHVDDTSIACTAAGEPRDRERHPSRVTVKAVTYHQLRVEHTAGGWVAEVYVDI